MVLDGPAIDEEANREGNTGGDGEIRGEADLGTVDGAACEVLGDQLVREGAEDANAKGHADGGGNENEATVCHVSYNAWS